MPVKRLELTGKRFNRLVVEGVAYVKNYNTFWKCKCNCGNEVIVKGTKLTQGLTNSCGCYKIDRIKETNSTHGKRHERIYHTYHKMKERCNNPKNIEYKNYGGRGIKVCKEWNDSFETFYKWAVNNGYEDTLSIDRIDNNKGYSPENCRWADRYVQANNKRNSHYLTFNNETLTIAEWSRRLGLSESIIRHRISRGWSIERTLTTTKLH